MSNLTSVGITSGVPTSGTGTVSTIDALMADGGQATLGAKADAKSAATDTTAISLMSAIKQVSASVQALAAGLITPGTFGSPSSQVLSVQGAVTTAATLSALASSATSAQLLASTPGRLGLMLTNTDANGAYVKYGTTASATSFTVYIPPGGYWEMPNPIYTGRIDAIWAADGSGSFYATELT